MESFPLHPRAQPPHQGRASVLQTYTGLCQEGGGESPFWARYKDTQNTQNEEENTQNTQNGEESVRHSPFCICLIKTTPIRGEWRKSL